MFQNLAILIVNRRPIGSVRRAPHYRAGGLAFESQTGPTLRVLNNGGQCAASNKDDKPYVPSPSSSLLWSAGDVKEPTHLSQRVGYELSSLCSCGLVFVVLVGVACSSPSVSGFSLAAVFVRYHRLRAWNRLWLEWEMRCKSAYHCYRPKQPHQPEGK